ncbi:MAG TPA: acyltransferase [Flavisolibacter sp.]|jgi:surface polysaccharide O-acyltransferase-like enzyme|nr:acyltransferase [Flavisolibacter sp.]
MRIISSISMILVAFHHSSNTFLQAASTLESAGNDYNRFIQHFFGQGLTRITVPVFFLISGYLFFQRITGSFSEFIPKFRKRTKTLLVPYLLWSAWGLFFFFALQQVPQARSFFNNTLIENYSGSEIVYTLLFDPIPYQLWFVRNLLYLVAFSPLIYWVLKYVGIVPLILIFVVYMEAVDFSFVILKRDAVFFFCLGAFLAIHKKDLLVKKRDNARYWIFPAVWLSLIFIKTALTYKNPEETYALFLLHRTCVVLGIISYWCIYDLLMINKTSPSKALLQLASFSFFIYAFHEPVLTIIKKGLFYLTGSSPIMSLTNYFLVPVITVLIGFLLARFFKKNTPTFYGIISGGR